MKKKFFFSLLSFLLLVISPLGSAKNFAAPNIIAEQCTGNICTPLVQDPQGQIFSDTYAIGKIITIQITAQNPEQSPIYSTQTWIKYNPQVFEVSAVQEKNSDFPLAAPGEMKAYPQEGLIKIGRAVAGLPVQNPKANIATIELKILQDPQGSQLEFYDFRANDVGKTSLLTLKNMLPENILTTKPKNIIFTGLKAAPTNTTPNNTQDPTTAIIGNILGQNTGGSTANNQQNINIYGTQNPYAQGTNTQQNNSTGQNTVNIPRPKGLRSRTYPDGKVEHLWKMGEDSRIKGYYLYYSTTSGKYMHRRDVGKTNTYRFPKDFFEKGKRVYFALQAYDTQARTSNFSDETYIVVGHSGSESHPFFEQIFPNVDPQDALIVRDSQGKIIYKGSRKNYQANITTAQKYPNPSQNVQTGYSGNFFTLFISLVFLVSGAYYYRKTYTPNRPPTLWA